MSPSTAPPFCSLTRSPRIVPLTRPQTVTFCAMTLPSTCAPSLIWRSEARTSPSIRPKTCAGPLHSMLPTIDMSEPMQEAIPAFVVGSDLAQVWSCGATLPITSAALTDAFLSFSGAPLFVLFNISTSMPEPMQEAVSAFGTSGVAATCSTTECCCCTIPPMTSAAFAAAFLSFSGALLLNNMSTSVFAGCANQKCHYDGAYDCEPFRVRCRVRDFISQRFRASHHPFDLKSAISLSRDCFVNKNCFVKKNLDNCRAARRELLKNLSRVVFRSQNGRQRSAPESSPTK